MPTVKSTTLKGDRLAFQVAGTEMAPDVSNLVLTWGDADNGTITFADAAKGAAQQGTLKGSAIQSTDSTSFWQYCWDNVGKTIAFSFRPWANTTPSATQPWFEGTVKIGKRPDLGGDAQIDGDDYTFDFEWKVQGDVTRKVSAS